MEGKVLSVIGGVCSVYSDGTNYNVVPRGVLRHQNLNVSAGDEVVFDEKELVITEIKKRKNSLIRPRSANIDLMLITMSVVEPELSLELLYKFLTYAYANDIMPAVLLTKIDRINSLNKIEQIKLDLEVLGIKVFMLSPKEEDTINDLKSYLKDKTTIIMGQTGVGKSSAINLIDPKFERSIGEYSKALGRGKHQTKEVILLPFNGGFVGDTPGFSSLELDLTKEEFARYFPGFKELYLGCYFSNCLHQNEKDCKIKEAVKVGKIPANSYEIYKKMLNTLEFKTKEY